MTTVVPPAPAAAQPAPAVAADAAANASDASSAPLRGRLLLSGGNMVPSEPEVYFRLIEWARHSQGGAPQRPEELLGVFGTASLFPEKTAQGYVDDFNRFGGGDSGGPAACAFDVTLERADSARDEALAERLSRCQGLFFSGGDQSRILGTFRPGGAATPAYHAVRRVLERGGMVAGTSAGAAMMSDPMILGGESATALLIGRAPLSRYEEFDRGIDIGPGMGFFRYGITDQHFLKRGRLGRLIAAMELAEARLGFGVDEDRAFEVELETGHCRTLGPRAVLVADRKAATREGLSRYGLRVSLFGGEDEFDAATGHLREAPGKWPVARMHRPRAAVAAASIPAAWRPYVIADVIQALAFAPTRCLLAEDKCFTLRFSADEETRFLIEARTEMPRTITALQVRLDILAKPSAEARAAQLRRTLDEAPPAGAAEAIAQAEQTEASESRPLPR